MIVYGQENGEETANLTGEGTGTASKLQLRLIFLSGKVLGESTFGAGRK
jgi:hypothetical protein